MSKFKTRNMIAEWNAHSKAKHRMWGVSFDQKKIHRVNQKLQLLKVSNLEKIGPKSDQNQSKISSLIQEPRPALLSTYALSGPMLLDFYPDYIVHSTKHILGNLSRTWIRGS